MGQTLTHGIYLPDEGERNCYAGLAANWQLLDGAVGTVASHTTALAGKAPLVHTHTKSDITDFPAYGTTAGTICEGNDSRLSDARTPVAHTHTKSDVTDLLNSNFIPSANNSYDLGSSSYQWNNLYAKNYYYNGVAWGLNKANKWTGANEFSNTVSLSSSSVTYNEAPSSTTEIPSIRIFGGGKYCGAFDYVWKSTGENIIRLSLGSYKSDGSFGYWACNFGIPRDFSNGGEFGTPAFYPNTSGGYDLGTSTNKWKSLNGINPGALSLPDLSVSQEIDRTGWVYDGGTTQNVIKLNSDDTMLTRNGWLYVRISNTVAGDILGIRLTNTTGAYPTNLFGETGLGHIDAFVPLVAGYAAKLFSTKAPAYCKFYPCLGNVPSGV